MKMAREIWISYEPSEKQNLFHGSNADEMLYGGAAGGGKSKAIVMEAFLRCLERPGGKAYLFRRTYRELEDTLIKEARLSIPKDLAKYYSDDHEMRFNNGSTMMFRHCEHEADRFNYQGAEMDYLFIDELTHFTQVVYDYLKTRLRAKLSSGIKTIVRCTANPGGVGHSWVKAYFVDPNPQGGRYVRKIYSETLHEYQDRVVEFIPARATDNPHISKDYIYELEQKPLALRRALLDGDWDAFEGQVFPEWRNDPKHYHDRQFTHVITPFPIPTNWKRYRSFDFGYTKPFSVGWWAMDPAGTLYRFGEWYGSTVANGTGTNIGIKMDPAEIAKGIADYETKYMPGLMIHGIADPSIFDESRGASVARMMEKHGVYFEPADNSRIAGKMQAHYRMRFDENGYPGMYIFTTCRNTIRTLPALTYNQTVASKVEDVDTDGEDHIYDDIRYMLMENPVAAMKDIIRPAKPYDPLSTPVKKAAYLP